MELSIFLAKLIGLYFILISLSLLLNRKNIDLLYDYYKHSGAILAVGVFDLGLGLALVLGHNVWDGSWRVAITIIGWLLLLRGIERMTFPEKTARYIASMQKWMGGHSMWTIVMLVVVFLIGLWFTYIGFSQ